MAVLGVFKYFDFFSLSVASVLSRLGFRVEPVLLNLALPIGISFYIFMAIGYLLDVKNCRVRAERDPLRFAAFMMFFPQLAAGPIGRANEMLPQFSSRRCFDNDLASDGLRQFLWGAFKKIAIADVAAGMVSRVFFDYENQSGSVLLVSAVLFTAQIYADFSGYSDMAVGVGKLFGIRLKKNFAFPYFATNIADFWRRWHISLTSWFRDYLYIPLGGSRCSRIRHIINTVIVFLFSGLWHGANWTYIAWGFLHGLLFVPRILIGKGKSADRPNPFYNFVSWVVTITCVGILWIFFRAPSIGVAVDYVRRIFTRSLFSLPDSCKSSLPWIAVMFLIEWVHRNEEHGLTLSFVKSRPVRWLIYVVVIFALFLQHQRSSEFIYFQF